MVRLGQLYVCDRFLLLWIAARKVTAKQAQVNKIHSKLSLHSTMRTL
jgi:hypothetical protein